jgi:hypothetical protein
MGALSFRVDLEDIRFVLFDQLKVHQDLATIDRYADFDRDTYEATIDEAHRIATEVLAPLNVVGDRQGCSVDADGNDVPGVRVPTVQAPLGTYTGWNLRARGLGHGAMHEFTGSYIPFPDTEAELEMTGDPRSSVQSRYGDAAGYTRAMVAAARRLVEDGLMLEEDVARVEAAARNWGRPRHELSRKG